jgi:flavodoxin I
MPEELFSFEFLILGTSTWDIGRLQPNWEQFLPWFIPGSLRGKKVALFGLGDQGSYPDTFVDGLGILADVTESAGATLVGHWPVGGYLFAESLAERGDLFTGLVIDEDCQPELTPDRIIEWTSILRKKINAS